MMAQAHTFAGEGFSAEAAAIQAADRFSAWAAENGLRRSRVLSVTTTTVAPRNEDDDGTWYSHVITVVHADDADDLTLEQALRRLIKEARSRDGVSGLTVRAALEITEGLEHQIAAFRKIYAELTDDGISEQALREAEAVLGEED